VDGTAKNNEQTTVDEARSIGGLVALLHRLCVPVAPSAPQHSFGREHWLELAHRRPDSTWTAPIVDKIDRIATTEQLATAFMSGRTAMMDG
jgi:hypothetical protein